MALQVLILFGANCKQFELELNFANSKIFSATVVI